MLTVHAPPPAAAAWVSGAVVVHLRAGAAPSRFPAMTQAMLTLRCAAPWGPGEAAGPVLPPVTFHTLATAPVMHAHEGEQRALGWLVRPAAAACLLGASTGALADHTLPWAVLAGEAEADRLTEALDQTTDDHARLRALLASLGRALGRAALPRLPEIDALCSLVGRDGAQAAATLGIGPRQLERRCQALLGVSPKRWQRLVRVEGALSRLLRGEALPGAALAADAGLYDESHLGRELRTLAGAPLRALLAEARPEGAGWALASHRALAGAAPLALP